MAEKNGLKISKDDNLTEKFSYKKEDNEELITDKPSTPLKKDKVDKKTTKVDKKTTKKNKNNDVIKEDDIKEDDIKEDDIKEDDIKEDDIKEDEPIKKTKSNKELYQSYINELKYYSLTINNEVIYDSSIDKYEKSPVIFDDDFFILYGKKYSYNGLKVQKINKR